MRTVNLVLISTLYVAHLGAAQQPNVDAERANPQGTWKRQFRGPDGRLATVVKNHAGDRSVVTTYDDKGAVLAAHTSRFSLERTKNVRIFKFFDVKVTAGPQAGHVEKGPFAYIYRIEGDRFVEAQGLLVGDRGPPSILIWTRVADAAPGVADRGVEKLGASSPRP